MTGKRSIPTALLMLALSCPSLLPADARAQSDASREEEDHLREVAALIDGARFDELEAMVAELRRGRPRFLSGRSKLRSFYRGVSWALSVRDPEDDRYRRRLVRLAEWRTARPESVAASLAEADCWLRYGWYPRGNDYVYDPPDDGPGLDERLAMAGRVLDEAARRAGPGPVQDPEYYRARLEVATQDGSGRDRLLRLLAESVAFDPAEEAPFALVAKRALRDDPPFSPREVAEKAVEMTGAAIGKEMYAVVAFETWPYSGSRLFLEHGFSWEETRQGFRDRLKRFPDSNRILNQFCLLATYAGDRETAHELFRKIDGRPDPGLWQGQANFQRRRAWADPGLLGGDQRVALADHGDIQTSVAYSPDGKWLATGGGSRRIVVRDARTGAPDHHIDTGHAIGVLALAYSPDGRWLASGGGDETIRLWEAGARGPALLGPHEGGVADLAYSPDGRYLASVGQDRGIALWDLRAGERVESFLASYGKRSMRAAFRPDSGRLAAVDMEGRLKTWDVPSGTPRADLHAHNLWSAAVAYSPDGSLIATGGAGGLVRLWNAAKEKPAGGSQDTHLPLMDVAFTPDGSRLVGATAATGDATMPCELLIWDVASKKLAKTLRGHKSSIRALSLSPDGSSVATVGDDMTLRIWDLPRRP